MQPLPEKLTEGLRQLTPIEKELLWDYCEDTLLKDAFIDYLAEGGRVEFLDNGWRWDAMRGHWFLWTTETALRDYFESRNLRVFYTE